MSKIPDEPNVRDADGGLHTDFEKAFRDGYQFEYGLTNNERQTVEFVTHFIGELVMPSGQLVACDPGIDEDFEFAFAQSLKPGRYPVFLSLAGFKPRTDSAQPENLPTTISWLRSLWGIKSRQESKPAYRRIACAMLQVSQQTPIRWEVAILNPAWSAEYQNYGVDSGTGCFMDAEVARIIKRLGEVEAGENIAVAFNRFEDEYWQPFMGTMWKNRAAAISDEYPYDYKGCWAHFCVNENTGANVIAFCSGWGDGGYASYWGYDAEDSIACIVTDFALFGADEDD